MEIKGKVHCFFEQSGTFKREFIKLGIPAEDYDIQNNFGETDHTDDLFQAIEDAYDGKPSLFDNITYDDFIMAFFPCIRFCGISQMNFALATHAQQSLEDGFASILRLTDERNYFYKLITKLVAVTLFRNLRMVIENPWQGQQYLHVWLKQPDLIDENRMRRGDYMIKPTAYWFWNCEPSRGFTYQPKNMSERKKFNIHGQYTGQANVAKGASKTGLCSEERSMISPDYARNFICDFILGIKQEIPHVQLALFDPSQSAPNPDTVSVQLCKGSDVMLRIYPDIHLNGDNINLGRAQQLDPTVTDLTLQNAGDLAARVGVTVRPRAIVTQKFADLLDQKKAAVERVAVIERPYVQRTGSETPGQPSDPSNPGTTPTNPDDPNAGND